MARVICPRVCRLSRRSNMEATSMCSPIRPVVRHLVADGHIVHLVTGAPDFVFTTEIQSSNLHIRKLVLDCGAVQADALTVGHLASLEKYSQTIVVPQASILATEVEWLHSIKADLVVSDVVLVACRAAADAGIHSVCVKNFSWDFIYAEHIMAAGQHHRSIVWQIQGIPFSQASNMQRIFHLGKIYD